MASSKGYLDFILEQLSGLKEIDHRAMMGEYILYYQGKVIGGVYDDRLMVKNTASAVHYIGNPVLELPYDGAKPMVLVENVDSREYLESLFRAMVNDLTMPKAKKKH